MAAPLINPTQLKALGLNLEQYCGLWCVDDGPFLQLFDQIARTDLATHVLAHAGDPRISEARQSQVTHNETTISLIEISGVMTKHGSSMSDSGSTIRIRQAVRQAANTPNIDAIMIRIDSPGGTVAGTADLAAEIARAAKLKPTHAYVEDMAASAAYWIASQALHITANQPTTLVGSIGTYVGLYDRSAQAEKEGIRPVVIKSGQFKAAGFAGTEITDEQIAQWQTIVDDTQTQFTAAVARGRSMSTKQVEQLADGRVHLADAAMKLGLIDSISTFDEAIAALAAEVSRTQSPSKRNSRMSEDTRPQPASYDDIKLGIPNADADFVCSQLESGATIEKAQAAWSAKQDAQIAALKADKEKATAEAAQKETDAKAAEVAKDKAKGATPAAGEPTGSASSEYDDPTGTWNQKIRAKVDGGMDYSRAARLVNRENPGLREAVVEQAKANR